MTKSEKEIIFFKLQKEFNHAISAQGYSKLCNWQMFAYLENRIVEQYTLTKPNENSTSICVCYYLDTQTFFIYKYEMGVRGGK